MADAAYANYRNVLLGGGVHGAVDLDADTIKITLTDHGTDTPVVATDQDYADISGGEVATGGNYTITTPTIGTAGTGAFDHEDATFTSVSGASAESYSYYKDTGTPSTSPLLVYIDAATGLPVTPNGGDITITLAAGGAWQV